MKKRMCSLVSTLILLWLAFLLPANRYQSSIIFPDETSERSDTSWSRIYTYSATSVSPQVYDIAEYEDNGIVLVGETSDETWVLRTDASGDVLVNAIYGGNGATSVDVSDEGSLVVTEWEYDLVKVSSNGEEIWNRSFIADPELESSLRTNDVVVCDSGGYAISGRISFHPNGGSRMLLMRTNNSGEEQWRKYYGDESGEYSRYSASCIAECNDGGFFLVGEAYVGGNTDSYLVRTDSVGNMIWNRTLDFEMGNGDGCVSGIQCSDDGFIMLTEYARAVRFDISGSVLWTRDFGYTLNEFGREHRYITAGSIVQCSSGGFAISGRLLSSLSRDDAALLIRTDEQGNMHWNRTFSGESDLGPTCLEPARLIERSSGGLALACTARNESRQAVWLIVTPDERTHSTTTVTSLPNLGGIIIVLALATVVLVGIVEFRTITINRHKP